MRMCWSAVDHALHNNKNGNCHIYIYVITTNYWCWSAVDQAFNVCKSGTLLHRNTQKYTT